MTGGGVVAGENLGALSTVRWRISSLGYNSSGASVSAVGLRAIRTSRARMPTPTQQPPAFDRRASYTRHVDRQPPSAAAQPVRAGSAYSSETGAHLPARSPHRQGRIRRGLPRHALAGARLPRPGLRQDQRPALRLAARGVLRRAARARAARAARVRPVRRSRRRRDALLPRDGVRRARGPRRVARAEAARSRSGSSAARSPRSWAPSMRCIAGRRCTATSRRSTSSSAKASS